MRNGVVLMNRTPLDRLALIVVIIGALNWLLVGVAQFDIITSIFGGSLFTGTMTIYSKVVFAIVGIAGLYSVSLLFRGSPANARD